MTEPTLTALLIIVFIFIFAFFAYSIIGKAHSNQDAEPQPRAISSDHPQSAGSEGLDPNTVHALPVLKYAGAKEAGWCAICLREFFDDMVKVIPGCGHVFHPECIDRWLLLHGLCPICRCSDVVGENVGAVGGGGEVGVDVGSGVHGERAADGRKLVASGSRSFRAGVERERAVSLQRTFSL